ncbi:MAG: 1-acyl-sn-glycerol-3-phosphate acyltransferase [Flavobacteriales bacterium]|nr:1-acyl-sn-glycerol-3-phosphate acyltransferase [Flavobacteriales bacterium]
MAKFIFWMTGWKVVGENPKDLKKMVLIAAPHTSNWDLLYARAAFYIMGVPVQYTVKKELFFFPLGAILKSLGGIPIDRKTKGNMVDKMARFYSDYDELCIMITPEATRSYSPEWKKGFYYISQKVNIPIILGFLDYKKKEAGIGPIVYPTGDYEKDLEEIKSFYRTVTPKFPEQGVR